MLFGFKNLFSFGARPSRRQPPAVAVAVAAKESREDAKQAGWDAAVAFREAEKVA